MYGFIVIYRLIRHILIPLLVYYLDRLRAWCLYHFSSGCHSLYVDLSDIYLVLCLTACCMTVLLLRDCMSPVHVGCTSIPLPLTLLVSVIPFILVLTIASVRPSVRLLLWPSQRLGVGSSDGLYQCLGAFWRWPTLWCRLEPYHWRLILPWARFHGYLCGWCVSFFVLVS